MTPKKPPLATTSPEPFRTVDELSFMRECAARINAFLQTYPLEAQHVLRSFVPYEHELVEVHKRFRNRPSAPPPGVTFGALFAAVLQTHHGTGYYLTPIVEGDKIVRLEVMRQDEEGDGHKA